MHDDDLTRLSADPPRDADLGRALRDIEDRAALQADWAALSARIRRSVRREMQWQAPHWYDITARWTRVLVPLAVAASLVLAALLHRATAQNVAESAPGHSVEDPMRAFGAVLFTRQAEARDALIGETSAEWLMTEVVRQ